MCFGTAQRRISWKAGPEPDDFDAADLAAVCGALA
jgi:hypothetical protein